MSKIRWCVLFLALALCAVPTVTEAQVVYVHPAWHGIPATPAPGNGAVRHYNNGYVGVNSRHWSRIPMKPGTGPQPMNTGPVVVYPPYPCYYQPYPVPYYPPAPYYYGGYVQGGYGGNGWYIQGGVAW
jgi:hypothetical protein